MMKRKPDSLIYIIVLFVLVVAGIITTAIINAVKSNQGTQTDIRARAGIVNVVKLTGTVSDINSTEGTITVNDVMFAPETRSGPATNYGTWQVTPPTSFDINSLSPGRTVTFVINSTSFDV